MPKARLVAPVYLEVVAFWVISRVIPAKEFGNPETIIITDHMMGRPSKVPAPHSGLIHSCPLCSFSLSACKLCHFPALLASSALTAAMILKASCTVSSNFFH